MATLYHYPLCPFSRKIRLLLRERNVDPDLITEAFWQKRKEFIRTNPSGDVPVLIIEKIKICGHYAITEFLEEKFETTFPEDINEKNECRRIMDWFDNKFHSEVLKIILHENQSTYIPLATKHRLSNPSKEVLICLLYTSDAADE